MRFQPLTVDVAESLDRPPDGWGWKLLGELGAVRYGLGQPPAQDDDGVPMIRATNVKRGRISAAGLIRIKKSEIPEARNPYLKAGDILVVRSGAYTGDVAMVTSEWEDSVAGYDLIFSAHGLLDPAFCAFYLLSDTAQAYFRSQRDRSAQPHLNRQQLETTRIPLPPSGEQRAIAHILHTVQRAKEATEQTIAAARQLKASLMRHLFTYGPVPVKQADRVQLRETEIGPIPEYWPLKLLRDIADVVSGGTPSKSRQDFWAGPIPWASPKDMKKTFLGDTEDHISEEAAKKLSENGRNPLVF